MHYKPPNTENNPTLEDPTPDYMNLLGMIFSMCGLMLKFCKLSKLRRHQTDDEQLHAVHIGSCDVIFAEPTAYVASVVRRQSLDKATLSPIYADNPMAMKRTAPLRIGGGMQPQGHNVHCHSPISGSSVCADPTYYHTVYDTSDEVCQVDYSKTNGGEAVVTDGTLYSLMSSDSLVPPIRRRGGLVDHRDVIKAHQSHKLQSTPQARRKQW
ncbi:hypothetical protein DNTS_017199, partial [Danionella cerebrum]